MYDVISGGSKIEFAFEIIAYDLNGEVFNKLLRNNVSARYKRCINKRAQNVFGGVSGSNFDAKSKVTSYCSGWERKKLTLKYSV